jgi:CheY-like chemotaxis protein
VALAYSHEQLIDNQKEADENASLTKLLPLDCHILLVEDNQLNSEVIQSLLTLMGATVDLASSGKMALDKVEHSHFDIVLMDIQMPDMDGIETTRRIRGMALASLPIIAVTANALHGDREWFLNNGFDDYLSKPIEPLVLRSLILRNLDAEPSRQKTKNEVLHNTVLKGSLKRDIDNDPFIPLKQANIDTDKALHHMMNNAELYISALEKFSSQRANFIDELNQFINQNKIDLAGNHVHSLASLSAMLGLTKVAALSRELESSFLDGKIDKPSIIQLGIELRGAITLIRAWLHMREFSKKSSNEV